MIGEKIIDIFSLWLPVFLWCAVIYYLSSVPELRSSLPGRWDFLFRKIAHMTEYGILTFLFFRAASKNLSHRKSFIYAVVFSIVYASTDEYHQLFVFGRQGDPIDVLIDSLGVFLAVFLIDKRLV